MGDTRLATVTTMSIYSDLLAMSLTLADDATRASCASTEKNLLEEVFECRDQLRADRAKALGRRLDASSRIAMELRYDRALINLCRLHAIPCDTARFARPQRERRVLEDALEAAGVNLRAARGPDSRHATRPEGHEPPVGS